MGKRFVSFLLGIEMVVISAGELFRQVREAKYIGDSLDSKR
jgi:hypothetical protein